MEYFNNKKCISFNELVCSGVITESNYKKKVREGKIRVIRQGKGKGNCALIDFDSLPDNIKTPISEMCKEKIEAMEKQKKEQNAVILRQDSEALKFFREYRSDSGSGIDCDRQSEYYVNAQVLNEMVRVEKERKTLHNMMGHYRPKEVWLSVYNTFKRMNNHTLPLSEPRIRQKFNEYKREGYVSLINKNIGNQATRKIGVPEGALLLKLKRSKFPVFTDTQLFDEYNRQAKLRSLTPIKSIVTMRNYLYDPKTELYWHSAVYGERSFKDKYMPTFDTMLPQMPNALWYSDGTRLNLCYKVYDERQKRLVARTTDVYEIMDAATEMWLGCYIGDGENFLSQYNAYREVIRTWKVKPYEIVTDNQGGHKKLDKTGFWVKICHIHKTTMPHNGQSKTIESAFGRFQMQVLHKLYNYSGQNITATKKNSHVNMDLIMRNVDELPTLEEMKKIYMDCRDEWNNSVGPLSVGGLTRREMYESIQNPKAEQIDDYQAREIFMLMSQTSVQYAKEGFIFTINNQEYRYMVYDQDGNVDMNFHLQNIGNSFYYRFDPDDMASIELWKVTGSGVKYAATATPKYKIHRATQERTDDENRRMFAQMDANRKVKAALYIAQEDLFLNSCETEAYCKLRTPLPVGISEKEMKGYRKSSDKGLLEIPVPVPDTTIPDASIMNDIRSAGDYTKKLSQVTDIDIFEKY